MFTIGQHCFGLVDYCVRCNVAKIIASLSDTAHGMGCMKLIFLLLAGFVTLFGLIAVPVQSRVVATNLFQTQAHPKVKTSTGTIPKSGESLS